MQIWAIHIHSGLQPSVHLQVVQVLTELESTLLKAFVNGYYVAWTVLAPRVRHGIGLFSSIEVCVSHSKNSWRCCFNLFLDAEQASFTKFGVRGVVFVLLHIHVLL